MSRAVSPIANRAGITREWNSVWYADRKGYANNLIEDEKMRRYIHNKVKSAGLDRILIRRSIAVVKVIIKVAKPGIVIGRKGKDLGVLRENLQKITQAKLDIQIEEVKSPDTSAQVVADLISNQIERRISPKRAINVAADKAMEANAKGIKVQISGTIFGPSSIATILKTTRGAVPTQTLRKNIDYAKSTAYTIGGTIGVKVWVNNGEFRNSYNAY